MPDSSSEKQKESSCNSGVRELLSVSNHYAIRQKTDVSYSFSPPFMVCFIIYLTDDKIKRLSNSPDRKKKMRQILT